jgi:hypothetical protein
MSFFVAGIVHATNVAKIPFAGVYLSQIVLGVLKPNIYLEIKNSWK